ncbi:MAG TPA: hypothetical protein VL334_01845 [Anaerolineae bacterium]|nr:hypothetical protein [Anaerolineae bacterium]
MTDRADKALLPGIDQSAVEDTPTFRDAINLRVELFDTRAGLYDGAGIDQVTFRTSLTTATAT